MNVYAWIGLLGVLFLSVLPLLNKKKRTSADIRKAAISVVIVLAIIAAVLFFHVPYIIALLFGFIAFILLDKKTYTKKRLLIYGSIVLIIGVAGYAVIRDNPDYVMNHLVKNPATSSFYLTENGTEFIASQADAVMPLASTVKMLIAVEYAMLTDAGALDPQSQVSLDELERFYLQDSDGGAHERWLAEMNEKEKIRDEAVTLHDVAKGMIAYSSNANTDYLLSILGIDEVNKRAKTLGLTSHEPVYPLVSPLLIPNEINDGSMNDKEIVKALKEMTMEEYRELATQLSSQMASGEIKAEEFKLDSSLKVQRVWSNRLPGASARDYGKLLALISHDELPGKAAETMRDLLEWPMERHESNQKRFAHLGGKGGSTAFILNDALYAEMPDGSRFEFVIFIDDLNIWQSLLLNFNLSSFESKILGDKEYRQRVKDKLTVHHLSIEGTENTLREIVPAETIYSSAQRMKLFSTPWQKEFHPVDERVKFLNTLSAL